MTAAPEWLEDERLEAFRIQAAIDDRALTGDAAGSHRLELIDWARIDESDDAIVEGLALPGRWTALVAPAKAGKSELILNVALHVSEGHEPFDRHSAAPVAVLHVDAEMGRVDLHERIVAAGFQPCDLTRFHALGHPAPPRH